MYWSCKQSLTGAMLAVRFHAGCVSPINVRYALALTQKLPGAAALSAVTSAVLGTRRLNVMLALLVAQIQQQAFHFGFDNRVAFTGAGFEAGSIEH